MEIRSSSVTMEKVNEFGERLLELLLQKKSLEQDIKALKDEFKEEGIAVGKVVRQINEMKRRKKLTDAELFEEEKIYDAISRNQNIDNGVSDLVSK